MEPGSDIPILLVTPDRSLPHRYARASGDFNPIHVDVHYARSVGQRSNILHGLYTMGLVARATMRAACGDPRNLRSISMEFRAPAFPEHEIAISGTVRSVEGEVATLELCAEQDGVSLVRNARAVVATPRV